MTRNATATETGIAPRLVGSNPAKRYKCRAVSLLASLLIYETIHDDVAWLTPDHFYDDLHANLFGLMRQLHEAGKPLDITLLAADFDVAELGKIAASAATAANLIHYANRVRELWVRRKSIEAAAEAYRQAHTEPNPVAAIQSRVEVLTDSLNLSALEFDT